MTCIVGLEIKNGIIMGCDSGASSTYDGYETRLKKVFKVDNFLIGYTSSFRMGQLLQYKLQIKPQKNEQSDLCYLATTFIDAVRECFKVGGFAHIKEVEESGGEFLVGYNRKIYSIQSDFQVNSSISGYMSCGCGEYFALGSMFTSVNKNPKARIMNALKAAGHFSCGVRKPYYTMTMKE